MVRWYADDLSRLLTGRFTPEAVHSVVVITKFPEALLTEQLRSVLAAFDQVVVQATVTGLGGGPLEPRVPPAEVTLAALPRIIEFVGGPERVAVRIDPIVHWAAADGPRDPAELRSNIDLFGDIARRAAELGVRCVKTSLVTPYPKVKARFAAAGLELVELTGDRREAILSRLEREAARAGVRLDFCCEPTRPRTACVDAATLTRLHPRGLPARPDRASGQREHCGCTHAIDLAWYSTHPCPSGCLYCYANPVVGARPKTGRRGPGTRAAGTADG